MYELLSQWHAYFLNADRIPETLAAIALTIVIGVVTGPLMGNANPVFWNVFAGIFGRLGQKMDRPERHKPDVMFRGFLLTALLIVCAAGVAEGYKMVIAEFPDFDIARILLLTTIMSSGTVWFALLRLYFAMDQDKVGEGAYYAIARSTRINLAASDDFGITRAAMGYGVKSFDKAIVSPALWYIIGGFPAACIYAILAMMSWRFSKNGLDRAFASVPMALERLMGFIPSLLTALLLILSSAFTPTAKLFKGITVVFGQKDRAPYGQGGYPISAMAWALNVSLGGPVQDLSGKPIKTAWIGPKGATAQLNHKHLRRAIYMLVIAHILFIACLLGMYMWSGIL